MAEGSEVYLIHLVDRSASQGRFNRAATKRRLVLLLAPESESLSKVSTGLRETERQTYISQLSTASKGRRQVPILKGLPN
jgi:hypothetical protein